MPMNLKLNVTHHTSLRGSSEMKSFKPFLRKHKYQDNKSKDWKYAILTILLSFYIEEVETSVQTP